LYVLYQLSYLLFIKIHKAGFEPTTTRLTA
jgi:hypothetical protein